MTYLIRHGWLNKEGAKTFALMEGYINGTSKVDCATTPLNPSCSFLKALETSVCIAALEVTALMSSLTDPDPM